MGASALRIELRRDEIGKYLNEILIFSTREKMKLNFTIDLGNWFHVRKKDFRVYRLETLHIK